MCRRTIPIAAVVASVLVNSPAWAQPSQDAATVDRRWQRTTEASGFVGFNYQRRKFRDFHTVESQNWLMGAGARPAGGGTLTVHGMLSLEPFTMQALGSPQVFQTGETFRGAPLVDYQHPHDLLMQLGTGYARPIAGTRPTTLHASGWLVGSPALGPSPFMHRRSAMDNPQVSLTHHYLDSTHITSSVVSVGVDRQPWQVEASWFRGREPDENRTDWDGGAPDSWSARLSWTSGGWTGQFSGARLREPERLEPFDQTRLTASIGYSSGSLDALLAWGENREIHGNLDAYLLEARAQLSPLNAVYTRVELAAKDLLDTGGLHPLGFMHPHRISRVAAFSGGFVRDLVLSRYGRLGVGGDVTGYLIAENLKDSYGTPWSFHVFVRLRTGGTGAAHTHMRLEP